MWWYLAAVALGVLAAVAALGPRVGYIAGASMEPTFRPGDGYVVIRPLFPIRPGDIVVYRPVVLPTEYVVHRVVEVGREGLITRGDAQAAADQRLGEPPVAPERVVGVVVGWGGRPLRIPGLRQAADAVGLSLNGALGRPPVVGAILAVGTLGLAWSLLPTDARRRRVLWRVRAAALGRGFGAAGSLLVAGACLLGSRAEAVEYLASRSPGDAPNHVRVGEFGWVRLSLTNPGFVPVAVGLQGGEGIVPAPDWVVVMPLASVPVSLGVPPVESPGWRRLYVQAWRYPLLLPAAWAEGLFRAHPLLLAAVTSLLPLAAAELLLRLTGWVDLPLGRALGLPRPR